MDVSISNIARLFSSKHVGQSKISKLEGGLIRGKNNVDKLECVIKSNYHQMFGLSQVDALKFLEKTELQLDKTRAKAASFRDTVNNEYHKKSVQKDRSLKNVLTRAEGLGAKLQTCKVEIEKAINSREKYSVESRMPASSDAQQARADKNKQCADQRKLDVKYNNSQR